MATFFSADSLRGVTHFVITAQSRSFTDAAEHLGISKSAVGKSIARLEERLGTRLFHRSTRKLSLTTDGEAYLKSCLSALDILDSAEHVLCRKQEVPSGTVRIDMPASLGRHLILPRLLAIQARYPALRLVLTFNDKFIDPIEEGMDLVFRLGELQSTDELIARCLSKQRLLLCATPNYISKRGRPETLGSLKDHSCIMGYRRGSPLAWRFTDDNGRETRFISATAHEIGDGDAKLSACLAGIGITQLPEAMVSRYLETGELVSLLEDHAPAPMAFNIIWPRTKHLFPKIRLIVDEMVAQADQGYFDTKSRI